MIRSELFRALPLIDESLKLTEFNDPFEVAEHPLAGLAVTELKAYLQSTTDLNHDFGLDPGVDGIGKMFGVLICQDVSGHFGYLSGFSGKLSGENRLDRFVPPVGDQGRDHAFVNQGMTRLSDINAALHVLEMDAQVDVEAIAALKEERRANSHAIQEQLFSQMRFLNGLGQERSLLAIFSEFAGKNPPAGAGECAAPKLLQYAFENELRPVAIAEFWWGRSRKSMDKVHGQLYPSCEDKCRPVLGFMLEGV